MSSARICERIPNARTIGRAYWSGMRLTCNKVAADGSGKANLISDERHTAWGVLYELDEPDWIALDGFEPGYTRQRCSVIHMDDQIIPAQVYLADAPYCVTPPHDWYRDHLLNGAREFGLPASVMEMVLKFGTY